jgi:hypothetical protein
MYQCGILHDSILIGVRQVDLFVPSATGSQRFNIHSKIRSGKARAASGFQSHYYNRSL